MSEENPSGGLTQQPKRPPILKAADRVLYPSTVGCTLVILGFQIWEFWQGGAYRPLWSFAEVYLAVLTAYGAQRELAKWKDPDFDVASVQLRRGELYVALWIATWLAMTAIANLNHSFVVPGELQTLVLGVLGIFAATGVSAGLRQRRQKADSSETTSVTPAQRKAIVIQQVNEKGSINNVEAGALLGVSPTSAWRLLEELEKENVLIQGSSANPRERRYQLKS